MAAWRHEVSLLVLKNKRNFVPPRCHVISSIYEIVLTEDPLITLLDSQYSNNFSVFFIQTKSRGFTTQVSIHQVLSLRPCPLHKSVIRDATRDMS